MTIFPGNCYPPVMDSIEAEVTIVPIIKDHSCGNLATRLITEFCKFFFHVKKFPFITFCGRNLGTMVDRLYLSFICTPRSS
jgi:hypothetical protein